VKAGESGSVSLEMAAAPEAVYDLVSDVTRMGQWSPETVKAEWIDGATGPAVGARFKGTNKIGFARWSTKPRVVAAERGREFAFVTEFRGAENTKWTYRFEPSGSGTKVTESFELVADTMKAIDFAERYVMRIKDRKAYLEDGMRRTLERIKAAAERGT
jgi:uncharacterized protein YndB with AHSA1/START domain